MALNNLAVATTLREMATLLELKGEDPSNIRTVKRAAEAVNHLPEHIGAVHRRGELRSITGIGPALEEKISELLTRGRLDYLEKLRFSVPPGLRDLTRIPGLDATAVAEVHGRLGIASLDELELAARLQRLRHLSGFGAPREASLLEALVVHRRQEATAPVDQLRVVANSLQINLAKLPGVKDVRIAGAVRCMAATATGLTLVVSTTAPDAVAASLGHSPGMRLVGRHGSVVRIATGYHGWPVDVIMAPPSQLWAALHAATGTPEHLAELMALGPLPEEPESEEQIYASLGLPFIPPELRAGGAVAAARADTLDRVVRQEQVRGDLHCHSRYSDGAASLAQLAATARGLGYEYLAITDHSYSLQLMGGLSRLQAQWREIDELNASMDGFRLLKGVEVDILKDGRLDMPDDILAKLDVVVASCHNQIGMDFDTMTARMCVPIQNPHVDIIGHPTGRSMGARDASPMDLEHLFALAARTGTALEINSTPDRLDLDGDLVRQARTFGAQFAVNTDAHSTNELARIPWGIGQARRGWLTAGDVVNTLSLPDLLEWLQRAKT